MKKNNRNRPQVPNPKDKVTSWIPLVVAVIELIKSIFF